MSGWRHARRYLFGAMAVLVALLLLFLVIRLLPAVDEDEVVEARRQIEALRESATHLSCGSDPPGDALERSAQEELAQEGLRDLFDWSGSFNACHRVAGTAEVYDALKGLPDAHPGEPGRQWRFSVEDQDVPVAAMAEGWGALSFQAPLYPSVEVPPVFLSVREACAGLPARLRDIAESRRGCSPFAVTEPGIEPLRLQVFSVAKAASVIARGRAAAGDVEGALTLLVHAAQTFHAMRRGPVELIVATHALAAESLVWSAFQTLLADPVELSDDALAALDAGLEEAAAWVPHPAYSIRFDPVASYDSYISELLADPETRADGRTAFVLAQQTWQEASAACDPETSWSGCLAALEGLRDPGAPRATFYSLEPILAWGVFLGPRSVRGFTNRELRALYLADITSYVKRLMRSPIQIAMAKVMLKLLAFRRMGICPDEVTLAPTWLEVPLLGEHISIRKLRGQEFELDAPSIVTPGDPGLLPLMLFVCPATGGGVWVD